MNPKLPEALQDLKKRPLKICILNPNFNNSGSILADCDPAKDPRPSLPSILPWTWKMHYIDKAVSHSQLQKIREGNFDIYFNFCDGGFDEDCAGLDLIKALEYFNLPYVGCDSKFFARTKKSMKRMFTSCGIPTPAYHFAYNEQDIESAVKRLKNYPLIVKHFDGYSSVGMTQKSRVCNKEELREQARLLIKEYGGALIEEYIEGDEYTVLVLANIENSQEPIVLDPVKMEFEAGETFKHFELKNIYYEGYDAGAVRSEELKAKLKELAKNTFLWWDENASFGRLDIRVNKAGEIFVLEINASPSIFYPSIDIHGSADLIIKNDPNWGFEKTILYMIHMAFVLHERKQKPYNISYREGSNILGMFALRDIKAGELIRSDEGKPVNIISKKSAEKKFTGVHKDWFKRYAIPVNDGLYSIPSEDLELWEPLNHSCEPNVWYREGELALEAMKDIKAGEEILIDYCVLWSDEEMKFECDCGSRGCRKIVNGLDYQKKELIELYNGHFYIPVQNKVDKMLVCKKE